MQCIDIDKQFDASFMTKAETFKRQCLNMFQFFRRRNWSIFSLQVVGVGYTQTKRKNIGHRIGLRENDD